MPLGCGGLRGGCTPERGITPGITHPHAPNQTKPSQTKPPTDRLRVTAESNPSTSTRTGWLPKPENNLPTLPTIRVLAALQRAGPKPGGPGPHPPGHPVPQGPHPQEVWPQDSSWPAGPARWVACECFDAGARDGEWGGWGCGDEACRACQMGEAHGVEGGASAREHTLCSCYRGCKASTANKVSAASNIRCPHHSPPPPFLPPAP